MNLLGDGVVHLAEHIGRKTLAKMNEEGRIKSRFGDEGLESAKVLEIRVLSSSLMINAASAILTDSAG